MTITTALLQSLFPRTKNAVLGQYIAPLNDMLPYYEITTKERLASFLAQVGHESGGFSLTKENLNYSAAGLRSVFGKYFTTDERAKAYEHHPEKIANKVYANRMGNGDEASGDGYKFRGRGLIQITGHDTYTKFAEGLGMDIDECIAYMETPAGATSSAGWYWDENKLNAYCDRGDFSGLTRKINGGLNGLPDRQAIYAKALGLI